MTNNNVRLSISRLLQEHQNFVAQDDALGPVLLSVKHEMLAGQDYVRLILRLQTGTLHEVVPATCLSDQASPHRMAKVRLSAITPVSFLLLLPFISP